MGVLDADTWLVLVGTFVGILLVKKLLQMLAGPKLPPGPIPFPFVGNIPQLSSRPNHSHLTLKELANIYGDAFTISIFNTKFIVLNTHEIVKEALIKNADAFSNRPISYLIKLAYDNGKGLIFQAGEKWKGIRRMTATSLRDFGVGKKSMEGRILEEASALVDVIADLEGNPFDPTPLVTQTISNIICSVCFGSRFEYTDRRFRSLVDKIVEIMSLGSMVEPIDHIPILRLFPHPSRIKKQLANLEDIDQFIRSQIEEHRATFDKNYLRDFIDLYLKKEGEDDVEDEFFSESNIRNVIKDLFQGGTDPTATSTRWAMVYLQHYPEIQERLGKEMEKVVGNERQPSINDKASLNYLQAFVMEILRHSSVAHCTLPYLCTAEREIGGYTIPKGATVLVNVYTIHMSERYWKNPTQFNPGRFLDADGKFMNINEGFIAFGAGPRQCIGETLARSQLFLVLACLIQKFTFKPEDEKNLPPMLGKAGFTLAPEQFRVRAIPK